MKKRRTSKKRGPVRAKKVEYDGIKFQSGLEKYMYIALRKAKLKCRYEVESYELISGFMFNNESYERQSNGKEDILREAIKGSSNHLHPGLYRARFHHRMQRKSKRILPH